MKFWKKNLDLQVSSWGLFEIYLDLQALNLILFRSTRTLAFDGESPRTLT